MRTRSGVTSAIPPHRSRLDAASDAPSCPIGWAITVACHRPKCRRVDALGLHGSDRHAATTFRAVNDSRTRRAGNHCFPAAMCGCFRVDSCRRRAGTENRRDLRSCSVAVRPAQSASEPHSVGSGCIWAAWCSAADSRGTDGRARRTETLAVEVVSCLDVRVRLLFLTALIICIGLTPISRTSSLIGYAALVVLVVFAGRVPLRWLARRLLPFLVLWLFGYGGVLLGADLTGVFSLWLRALLTAVCALAYTWTTPFTQTVAAMSWFRLPGMMVAIAALAYRFFSVLGAEATSMARAYAARRPPPGAVRAAVVGAKLSRSLLMRAYHRSERIADAMVARGYDGTFRLLPLPALSLPGLLAAALLLGVLVGVWLIG